MKNRKKLRAIVLIVGLAISAFITIIPLIIAWASTDELLTEQFTGLGLGWIIISLPYVLFWYVANKSKLKPRHEIYAAAILLISGIAGFIMTITVQDPQTGLVYILYVLPVQYFAVATIGNF